MKPHRRALRSAATLLVVALIAAVLVPGGIPASAHSGPHDPAAGTTFTLGGSDPNCGTAYPAGSCTKFTIANCQGVTKKITGFFARADAASPKGMLVVFSGGPGKKYWSDNASDSSRIRPFLDRLRSGGISIVQVRWGSDWLAADLGHDDGLHVACRPARIIKYLHDQLWAPLGVTHPKGACGFCVMGTSGGSSAVAWALTHFKVEAYVDAVFPTGGPPHGAMAKGCAPQTPAEVPYSYIEGGSSVSQIDNPFKLSSTLECRDRIASYRAIWDANSIGTTQSAGDQHHAKTRVHLIDGLDDPLRTHGWDWMLRMWAVKTPFVSFQVVPGAPHSVSQSQAAMDALEAAVVQTKTAKMRACNNGIDDDGDGTVDYVAPSGAVRDEGCRAANDATEKRLPGEKDASGALLAPLPCDNGIDDDADGTVGTGDGFVDYPVAFSGAAAFHDPGCEGPLDPSEDDPAPTGSF